MYEENKYYYNSNEDSYKDFDDDELYDAEKYYLSEGNIDNLIHIIRMYGSKYQYLEIEELTLRKISRFAINFDYAGRASSQYAGRSSTTIASDGFTC
jgi:hypothetical protein